MSKLEQQKTFKDFEELSYFKVMDNKEDVIKTLLKFLHNTHKEVVAYKEWMESKGYKMSGFMEKIEEHIQTTHESLTAYNKGKDESNQTKLSK